MPGIPPGCIIPGCIIPGCIPGIIPCMPGMPGIPGIIPCIPGIPPAMPMPHIRGLHSSTFQLNLSAYCGIGGACKGCLGGV